MQRRAPPVALPTSPESCATRWTKLTSLPAFQAFAAGVKERCVVPPERSELTEIGSYGWFDR